MQHCWSLGSHKFSLVLSLLYCGFGAQLIQLALHSHEQTSRRALVLRLLTTRKMKQLVVTSHFASVAQADLLYLPFITRADGDLELLA